MPNTKVMETVTLSAISSLSLACIPIATHLPGGGGGYNGGPSPPCICLTGAGVYSVVGVA